MQIIRFILILCVLVVLATVAFGAPSYVKGENHQSIDTSAPDYGLTQFACNGKLYSTDVQLQDYQGCETQDISYGPQGLDAKLVTAFHGWRKDQFGQQVANRTTFIDQPDGKLYRLKTTGFLTSEKLQQYFEDAYGLGRANLGRTNLDVMDYSVRNIQAYGNTFCVTHFMKFPFRGTMGWCQGDHLVGGDAGYLDGVMTFSRAAIVAQGAAFDKGLEIRSNRLFHPRTRVVLKTDKHGYMYWGFGVPAESIGKLSAYGLRVYFNGQVFVNEYPDMPTLEEL